LGIGPLATAALGIVSTIALGAWLARRLGLKTDFGLLCGAAVSICGASAALAVSAVMPKSRENERRTLLTV
ncbi:putative sulfate exporter family transporter, partial [Neisseria gonorrhoeae]